MKIIKKDYFNFNLKLPELRQQKLKGYLVRSRSKCVDDGEKVTNYVCNLEKQHISSKSLKFIEKQDGTKIFI